MKGAATRRRAAKVAALLALSALPGAEAAGAAPDPGAIEDSVRRLTQPPSAVSLPPLPQQPVDALVQAANAHSASLGFTVDHGPRIRGSGIAGAYAGRVAQLLEAVVACRSASEGGQRRACAERTGDAASGVVTTSASPFRDISAWPSLYIDGDGGSNLYRHDYAVLVDRGGNDVYDNNAGGNLIDVKRGPAGSAAERKEPAIGCEQVQGNFPAPTATAHDCIAAPQVALVDYAAYGTSNDAYGVLKAPRAVDHNPPATGARRVDGTCTNDRLVRRIVTQGSGFEGNGLLMDVGGDDFYPGKTSAQGAGHVGGVGVLRDLGGTRDRYLAIRNAQGFGLVGMLGLLQDDGGSDRYDHYMPRPKVAGAPFQADGSGGVIDDTGVCDNMRRMLQGTALLGGVGYLLEQDGADTYVGTPDNTQQFSPLVQFFHSSQGFGCSGGVGILRDTGRDDDSYLSRPGRTDGISRTEVQTSCQPAAPGLSVFSDDGL